MADRVVPGPVSEDACIREAVCVHTKKIFDSCRSKDCIEDLRLYPTSTSQSYIDSAVSVRAKSAELLFASIDVEEMTFNRGYYTVDVRYFYKVCGSAYSLAGTANDIVGLAVFDKRSILFGSEGSARVFKSDIDLANIISQSLSSYSKPTAVLEAVDPIVLNMKLVDICDCCGYECAVSELPGFITGCYDSDLVLDGNHRRVYVSLGQFSTLRLERDTQLLIPTYDYCMPEKECVGGTDDDPCSLFSRISFPVDEFFPPDSISCPEGYREAKNTLCN